MFKLFKKKNKSNLVDILDEYIQKKEKDKNNTYVFVKFAKKDKSITYLVCKLEGNTIKINNVYYYVDNNMLFTWDYIVDNKNKYKITQVDVYEDLTLGYNPYLNQALEKFNEKIQKFIYLQLLAGIMETKLKKGTLSKKMIILILVGIAAVFIFFKLIVKQ